MTAYIETVNGTVIETDSPECWTEAKRLTAKDGKARLHAESLATLRELFPPGADVWTKVTSVARSGMSRHIQVYALPVVDGKVLPMNVSAHVGRVLDARIDRNDLAIVVSGCGMDMCFHTVYHLGRVLYPDGFTLPPGRHGRNGDTSERDTDGGYALNKRDL